MVKANDIIDVQNDKELRFGKPTKCNRGYVYDTRVGVLFQKKI